MRLRQRSMLTGVAVLLTATLLSFGPANGSPTAYAQTQGEPTTMTPQGITVVGEGSSAVEPDIAVANIGVQVANADVRAASDEAEEIMNAVIAAIQEQGVAEEDIQTSGFSIFAEFSPAPAVSEQPQTPLYRVSNNVNVTIRQLDQVATILDAAIGAGANNIFGVTVSVDDPSTAAAAARAEAIDNAAQKAQDLAQLTGLQLGNVVSVSEIIGSRGGFYASTGLAAASQAGLGGGGGPIAPGQLNINVQLEVVYGVTAAAE